MVGLLGSLFLLAGLSVDGGRIIATKTHLIGDAQEAARTGAQALSEKSLYTGGADIDRERATRAALAYLAADGDTGTVTITGSTVHVIAHTVEPMTLWRAAGIDTLTLTGEGSAVADRSSR